MGHTCGEAPTPQTTASTRLIRVKHTIDIYQDQRGKLPHASTVRGRPTTGHTYAWLRCHRRWQTGRLAGAIPSCRPARTKDEGPPGARLDDRHSARISARHGRRIGKEAERPHEGGGGWRDESPGATLRTRPEVPGEDPRIHRIAAIIQRAGHAVAGVHINAAKDGEFCVAP